MGKQTGHIAAYIAVGKVLAMVLNFVTPLFLTRFLTKADYGIYSQFNTVFLFLGSIFGMGIQSNLYFFYPSIKDELEKSRLITNTFLLLTLTTALGVALFLIPTISNWVLGEGELKKYLFIIVIATWLYVPTRILDPLFTLRKDGKSSVLFPPIETIGKLMLILLFALIFKDVKYILCSVVIFQLGCFIYAYSYAQHSGMSFHHYQFDWREIKKIIAYSLPFGLAVILYTLSSRFDKLICISYLTTEQYAIYSLAFFGIPGVMQVYDALCQVNVMDMAKAYHQNNYKDILLLYRNFVIKTLSFSLPIITIVFIFAKQIIVLLFTENYIEAVPFFQVYILTFIVAMLGAGTILRAINKTRMSLKAYAISVFVYIPVTYLLIKSLGMWGAMTGALIGNILPRIIQIRMEISQMKCSFSEYFPILKMIYIMIIGFGFGLLVYVINTMLSLSIYGCGIVGCIYLLIAYYIEIKTGLIANPLLLVFQKYLKRKNG